MVYTDDQTVYEIQAALALRAALYSKLDEHVAQAIYVLSQYIGAAFIQGGKLLTCGNGGSAAEAQHLAEELIGRFRANRRPLPAIALTADGTALTCIANDFGYDQVFARQVQGLAQPGDAVLLLSTSGSSSNLLAAAQAARTAGAVPLALLGGSGGALYELCDHVVLIPEQRSDLIQEAQLSVVHLLCALIERQLRLSSEHML